MERLTRNRNSQKANRAGRRSRRRSVYSSDQKFRLAAGLDQIEALATHATWILCPWFPRTGKASDIWLSILPIHDINQLLLDELPPYGKRWANVFAGVLAVDPFRSPMHLIRSIKASGLAGVVNFPSATFVDGKAGAVFERLSLGLSREIEFLSACAAEGLRIGAVTNSANAAKRLIAIGAEFLIVHRGPPTLLDADPSKDLLGEINGVAEARKLAVIGIESLVLR